MTSMADIEIQAAALRRAVTRGDFESAGHCARIYCYGIRAFISNLDGSEAARVVSGAQELLEWAQRNFRASRAHLAVRLRDIQRLAQYQSQPQLQAPTFSIRG